MRTESLWAHAALLRHLTTNGSEGMRWKLLEIRVEGTWLVSFPRQMILKHDVKVCMLMVMIQWRGGNGRWKNQRGYLREWGSEWTPSCGEGASEFAWALAELSSG